MEPKDLVKVWGAPDNSRLTKKQYAMRFPVHVMAKVNAINEMYPAKTKMEIVGDLLAAALSQFVDGLSNEPDEDELEEARSMGYDPSEGLCGQRRWFSNLVDKHMKALEEEERKEGSEEGGAVSPGKGRKGAGKGKAGNRRVKGTPRPRSS